MCIKLYDLLQKTDGAPVHLKRGIMDKMLYRTTMGLTIGGTIYCLMALYIAAQPQKPQWPTLPVPCIVKYISYYSLSDDMDFCHFALKDSHKIVYDAISLL